MTPKKISRLKSTESQGFTTAQKELLELKQEKLTKNLMSFFELLNNSSDTNTYQIQRIVCNVKEFWLFYDEI